MRSLDVWKLQVLSPSEGGGAAGFLSGALDGASISSALHHLLLTLQRSAQQSAICSQLHLHRSEKFYLDSQQVQSGF